MKRVLFILLFTFFITSYSYSNTCKLTDVKPYSENNKYYGLKNTITDEIIVKPIYRKAIKLGNSGWLIQSKRYKYGYMNNCGEVLIQPKYNYAERYFDKWIKLGNNDDFGIYNENGQVIIPNEYTMIEPMLGERFLTLKKNKYGICNNNGDIILSNRYDYIYMPTFTKIRIRYNHAWYELEKKSNDNKIILSDSFFDKLDKESKQNNNILYETGMSASYGVVTATDYTLKVFSTISTAYEASIDELTLSKGVEAVPILMNFSWLPKLPYTYVKNYYKNISKPDNSPLSDVRNDLIKKIK